MDYLLVFVVGLIFGSFYNVLIYRLPRGISVTFERSKCPHCGSRIRWYDNIPVISYLILRGRCRDCGGRISLQYPLVELASGLLALLSYFKWGLSPDAIVYYAFFSALLVASVIDINFFILPDVITIPGIIFGLGSSFFREDIDPVNSFLGAIVGFTVPFFIYLLYVKVRKMEGLGIGDIKLLTFIGSVTGIYGVLSSLFLGSVIGLLFAVPSILRYKNVQFVIPFGPFLSMGCFIGTLLKDRIMSLLLPA